MSNYEVNLDALVNRAFEERCDNLATVIEKENLYEYELGHVDIIYADDINWAVVPCEDYMILAHEHYDYDRGEVSSEYAIYSQHDNDGNNATNTLNMNAIYKLEFIGEETFTNMAYAIAHAANLVRTITTNDRNMKED